MSRAADMSEGAGDDNEAFGSTLRPSQYDADGAATTVAAAASPTAAGRAPEHSSAKLANSGVVPPEEDEEEQLDVRASQVCVEALHVDIPAKDLRVIMECALRAYNTHVFVPTRTTWRKEEGSRRELERDVERTALSRIAEDIHRDITAKLGGCWHVIYGHDFATFVTHKRLCFCHFQLEGADVVVWRHGG